MIDVKKLDLENLDELIAKCEEAMVRPFSKKKQAIAIEVEPESSDKEVSDEDAPTSSDLSDLDLEDLLEAYRDLKAE